MARKLKPMDSDKLIPVLVKASEQGHIITPWETAIDVFRLDVHECAKRHKLGKFTVTDAGDGTALIMPSIKGTRNARSNLYRGKPYTGPKK